MPNRTSITGSELFIVDNSDTDWKALRYLHDWCGISKGIDIATGYFEIGALLGLKGQWQNVDHIRILMGEEVSARTSQAFEQAMDRIKSRLDESLEVEKQTNDFLTGVDAIVQALRSGKIQCRVYRKDKFHAKAYITHARMEVVGSSALVGSSNFTVPGLTRNVELNVQITGRPVAVLQEWYNEHWDQAEEVTPEILRIIERHTRDYTPFEVYARSLHELFAAQNTSATEWEKGLGPNPSRIYPLLDAYQQEGYHRLQEIAARYRGAFLCDGVGLGKTYVGLMLIEWLTQKERRKVVLFVPKAARAAVWEAAINRHLPDLGSIFGNDLRIYSHSDLGRGGELAKAMNDIKRQADAIIIDEAHHFRNTGIEGKGIKKPSRYRRLYEICQGKQMYLLTATPVNNRLIDLQHMIELFSRKQADYFKDPPLNIHSLPGHFRSMESDLKRALEPHPNDNGHGDVVTDMAEAEKVLSDDALFRKLVVQRSRATVKKSQQINGGTTALFPRRDPPRVADYELKKTYGRLLQMLEKAFSRKKALFSLAIYSPLAYAVRDIQVPGEEFPGATQGRQNQVVSLVRTSFLKRFESSPVAFEASCLSLLRKLLAWTEVHAAGDHEKHRFERWKNQHADLIGQIQRHRTLWDDPEADEDIDFVPPEMLDEIDLLDPEKYKIKEMLDDTYLDLDQLAEFLRELARFKPSHDDKLKRLIKLLKDDPELKDKKVLIFSEFMDTARYLKNQLIAASLEAVEEIDSASKTDRGDIIRQFSPYYNDSSTSQLAARKQSEIRILISTDVLSEGLNLQDATRLINYDLHWNPVRLMQRIGRVDRRMNAEIEQKLLTDHPELKPERGRVVYWNFLPPDELNNLLSLYSRVTHKTLRISKTFGIEGKKLLTPDDDYQALKDFNEACDGTTTPMDALSLEYRTLMRDHPELASRLDHMPRHLFSGRQCPDPAARGVFFCYTLPAIARGNDTGATAPPAEETRWYLYDLATGQINEDAPSIAQFIRSTPDTPRVVSMTPATLAEIRAKVEKHIKNTYLKSAGVPADTKPALRAWMELN